jgi:hypothetical protein
MGFRMRKSMKVAPGVRLSVSKRGVGASVGAGGSPYDTRNLWMQPASQARRDDRLESGWHRDLCAGRLTLRAAQRAELASKRTHG